MGPIRKCPRSVTGLVWFFQSGLLPSGLATEEGLSLELRQVQRDDAGVYVCTANNGVGPTAKANIEVEIKCKFLRLNFYDRHFIYCFYEMTVL
jgi:hypothetical protein